MSRSTYMLGAGASAEVLPCVNEIPARLKLFREYLYNEVKGKVNIYQPYIKFYLPLDHKGVEKELFIQIDWILEHIGKKSVDQYAKDLYERNQMDAYRNVKAVLTAFFVYEQWGRNDERYDNFIASISKQKRVPENLKILSWNYDVQFERSYLKYTGTDLLHESDAWNRSFSLYKLNGTAGFITEKGDRMYFQQMESAGEYKAMHIVNIFASIMAGHFVQPTLTFAWENKSAVVRAEIEKACSDIADTEVLVVIGYSFPWFNKDIDHMLLSKMTKLTKIYVNDLYPDAVLTNLPDSIRKNKSIEIVPITNTGTFHIPVEL